MSILTLSLFPGVGLLDRAFEEEGFCVVRGPDVLWGGDIRCFHPPPGVFKLVIGGPPCQSFTRLVHIVRATGHEPRYGNLIPEFERCVRESQCAAFLMEEVPDAPVPVVEGYGVWSTRLNNRQLGEVQNRVRRISFGVRGGRQALEIETVALEPLEYEYAACGGWGGSLTQNDRRRARKIRHRERQRSTLPNNSKGSADFARLRELQGLPADWDLPGFTVAEKCRAVGNGVPLAMGRALAVAVRGALEQLPRMP